MLKQFKDAIKFFGKLPLARVLNPDYSGHRVTKIELKDTWIESNRDSVIFYYKNGSFIGMSYKFYDNYGGHSSLDLKIKADSAYKLDEERLELATWEAYSKYHSRNFRGSIGDYEIYLSNHYNKNRFKLKYCLYHTRETYNKVSEIFDIVPVKQFLLLEIDLGAVIETYKSLGNTVYKVDLNNVDPVYHRTIRLKKLLERILNEYF